MSAVPSEQNVDLLLGGNDGVERITGGDGRQDAGCQQFPRKSACTILHGEDRQASQGFQSATAHFRVPQARLPHHFPGSEALIIRTPVLPPLSSELLMCSQDRIRAGLGDQVADDGGFDLNGFHGIHT